jgi:hypothetical protein
VTAVVPKPKKQARFHSASPKAPVDASALSTTLDLLTREKQEAMIQRDDETFQSKAFQIKELLQAHVINAGKKRSPAQNSS